MFTFRVVNEAVPAVTQDELQKMNAYLKICSERPPVRPFTRKLEMLRTKIENFVSACVNCKKKVGKLTCSRCMAVQFCSAQCQKVFWPKHKKHCNDVKDFRHALESQVTYVLEVRRNFLKSKEVREGRIDWIDVQKNYPTSQEMQSWYTNTPPEVYLKMRQMLLFSYVNIGDSTQSPLAYRLAVENALDMLCMSYKCAEGEMFFKFITQWMACAGMDREALNFLVYLDKRKYTKEPFRYLDIDRMDADIEDPNILDRLLGKNAHNHRVPYFPEHHIYIIGILLKYKKLQHNMMERRKSIVQWTSFLMGTHPEVGQDSPIQNLKGNRTVLEKIQNMVVDKGLVYKLWKEPSVIVDYLKRMQMRTGKAISQLLDPRELKKWEEECGRRVSYSYSEAWKSSPTYHKMLRHFQATGKITDKPWHEPMEGFFQASVDTDPSKDYGDCSEFSLICHKSRTSVHSCKS